MAIFSRKMTGVVFVRDLITFAAVYILGLMLLPRDLMLACLNGILASICLMVVVLFSPSVVELFRAGASGVNIMRAAIAGAWADQMIQALLRIYFIAFRPDVGGRTFDATYGLPAVGYILFASMHIIAIGMVAEQNGRADNDIVRRNVHIIMWAATLGASATSLTIFVARFWHQ